MAIDIITSEYSGEIYKKMNEIIAEVNSLEVKLNGIKTDIYPVGSILQTNNNTNPGTYLGGTWVEHAKGRVLVGVDTTQTEFNSVNKTGGSKTHKLTEAEMPRHYHTGGTASTNSPTGGYARLYNGAAGTPLANDGGYTGGDQPHNNLQPYQTVYIWRKTAN